MKESNCGVELALALLSFVSVLTSYSKASDGFIGLHSNWSGGTDHLGISLNNSTHMSHKREGFLGDA